MTLAISLADVEAARERIEGRVRRTPVLSVEGTALLAKCEGFQETGSFKLRGATNAVRALEPAGVVTASSGNHGAALAAAARDAGIPAVVVMTEDSSPFKRSAVKALGARVVACRPGTDERARVAGDIAAAEHLTLIPPYDHPLVMAGQGTVGLEIVDAAPDTSTVVVPIGGGGLISGVATAVRGRDRRVRLVGVEPAGGDDTSRSLKEGRRVRVDVPQTICDGARVQTPGELTFPIVEALVDDVIVVTDDAVVEAMLLLVRSGLWVEPTGALSVAGALLLGLGAGTVCVVTGRNVGPREMARLLVGARGG